MNNMANEFSRGAVSADSWRHGTRIGGRVVALVVAVLLCATAARAAEEWRFVLPEGTGVVNVKDYGAVGDGVADDTTAIARAISENIDKARYRSNPFFISPIVPTKSPGPSRAA